MPVRRAIGALACVADEVGDAFLGLHATGNASRRSPSAMPLNGARMASDGLSLHGRQIIRIPHREAQSGVPESSGLRVGRHPLFRGYGPENEETAYAYGFSYRTPETGPNHIKAPISHMSVCRGAKALLAVGMRGAYGPYAAVCSVCSFGHFR
jgi:hypothetical protein